MTALVPAIGGALVVVGIIGVIVGVIPQPDRPAAPRRRSPLSRLRLSRRSRLLLGAGVIAGAIVAIVTGWLLAVVIAPLAAVGLPLLLSASDAQDRIARLAVRGADRGRRARAGIDCDPAIGAGGDSARGRAAGGEVARPLGDGGGVACSGR